MKPIRFLLYILVFFTLSSCIEIVDDITLNEDGSGTLKYNVNLSASKVKINSILALDSLDGKKVPSRQEIQAKIDHFKGIFEQKQGISNVIVTSDYDNYMFKLTCDFESVKLLQSAIKKTLQEEVKDNQNLLDEKVNWLQWVDNSFVRSVPEFTIKKVSNLTVEETELLKQGSYISITRFKKEVKDFTNDKAVLAKNKLAVMLKTNLYSLSQNPNLLENTIYLSPQKP
jgi:hypothetical protein